MNVAERCQGRTTIAANRWAAFGLVRNLLLNPEPVVADFTRLLIGRRPRAAPPRYVPGVGPGQLKNVDGAEAADPWPPSDAVDLLETRAESWFTPATVDRTWYDGVMCEGGVVRDYDSGILLFYSDHHRWSPLAVTVLIKLLNQLWKGWAVKFAHQGLSDLLDFIGAEESVRAEFPPGFAWFRPADCLAAPAAAGGPLVWLSVMEPGKPCRDYWYGARWDGLLGLLRRGPAVLGQLPVPSATAQEHPAAERVVGGAVIDLSGRVSIWPDSPEQTRLVGSAWGDWKVHSVARLDGWTKLPVVSLAGRFLGQPAT